MGVWEYGSMGVWEYGNAISKYNDNRIRDSIICNRHNLTVHD
jgi:hypothetical protein